MVAARCKASQNQGCNYLSTGSGSVLELESCTEEDSAGRTVTAAGGTTGGSSTGGAASGSASAGSTGGASAGAGARSSGGGQPQPPWKAVDGGKLVVDGE